MVEQVYDPVLGRKRDPFPGEIVPSEQEKTLQRLMREDAEAFRQRYRTIIDQLTPQQQDAIAAAEELLRERKRKEYLEAVKQNPAIIIQGILKEFDPANEAIKEAFLSLDGNVASLQRFVTDAKVTDSQKTTQRNTLDYARRFLEERGGTLISINILQERILATGPGIITKQTQIVFSVFRNLGLLPTESLDSFNNLRKAIVAARNDEASGKPYVAKGNAFDGFRSNKPGLEGIGAILGYNQNVSIDSINNQTPKSVYIVATPEALARIIDRGQYVPYGGKK